MSLDTVPTEILLATLKILPRSDLLRAIRVCRRWHAVGKPMIYQYLSLSCAPGCHRCSGALAPGDTVGRQRLRVFGALLYPEYAAEIQQLTITDVDTFCLCQGSKVIEAPLLVNSFTELCSERLNALLPKAQHLQSLRWETHGHDVPLGSTIKQFQPTNLKVMFPRRRLYGSTRLRHLTIDGSPERITEALPRMVHLKSLEIKINQANVSAATANRLNLSDFTRLEQLHIEGSIWSNVQKTFTGESRTIQTCILQGPLVLGKQSDDFFGRIATGLRSVFCQGTHLVGELETTFPQLNFLALHKTIHSTGAFPFHDSKIRAVSLETDDSYGPDRLQDSNDLLQLVLTNTRSTLRFLALRSGLVWTPSSPTIQSFQNMACLSALMLDGAISFERNDWTALHRRLKLDLVAAIDTWIESAITVTPFIPDLVGTSSPKTNIPGYEVPSEACRCGQLTRRITFQSVGIDKSCFDIYSWLLADPRVPDCAHRDMWQEG